jgi:hypothetical protein
LKRNKYYENVNIWKNNIFLYICAQIILNIYELIKF